MKVSVFNIVTSVLDMLKFSTKLALENAGNELDYIIICWDPTPEVLEWIDSNGFERHYYKTDSNLKFIENARNCFNMGFEKGFEKNDYTCDINTDMAFYKNWLVNLAKYARKNRIINCHQVESGVYPSLHVTRNFGIPTEKDFDLEGFYTFCSTIYEDRLLAEAECEKRVDAHPHLMHRSTWEDFGPWNVKITGDVAFFDKARDGGVKMFRSLGSIVYHYGRVEIKSVEDKDIWLRLKRTARRRLRNIRDKYVLRKDI